MSIDLLQSTEYEMEIKGGYFHCHVIKLLNQLIIINQQLNIYVKNLSKNHKWKDLNP